MGFAPLRGANPSCNPLSFPYGGEKKSVSWLYGAARKSTHRKVVRNG
jgi:hypothetical protein